MKYVHPLDRNYNYYFGKELYGIPKSNPQFCKINTRVLKDKWLVGYKKFKLLVSK